jgi:hypothetical protein
VHHLNSPDESRRYLKRAVKWSVRFFSTRFELIGPAQERIQMIKREHPLQLLAACGATSVVIGMLARGWRARHP